MSAYDENPIVPDSSVTIDELLERVQELEKYCFEKNPRSVGDGLWNLNSLDPGHQHQQGVYRSLQVLVFAVAESATTGDGKAYIHIDQNLDGMTLTYVHARVVTAGTTGTMDIQIANVTDSVDMLSTKLTIDSAETGSNTAATPAVIDTTKDDVAENDVLRIDIDAIQTTAAKGLIVTMGFQLKKI